MTETSPQRRSPVPPEPEREERRGRTREATLARETLRTEAFALHLSGLSSQKIADRLGCSRSTASKWIREQLAELRAERLDRAELERDMSLGRIETLIAALWPDASAGDTDAVREITKLEALRIKLLGLDAPTKIEVTGKGGGPIQIEPGMDLSELSDEQLRRLRDGGPLPASMQTIDVHPARPPSQADVDRIVRPALDAPRRG